MLHVVLTLAGPDWLPDGCILRLAEAQHLPSPGEVFISGGDMSELGIS